VFAAVNLDILPKIGPEEINIATVVNRQARVEEAINRIAAMVQELAAGRAIDDGASAATGTTCDFKAQSLLTDMQQKLDAFTSSVNARLDHLNTVCSVCLNATNSQDRLKDAQQTDRKLNIIVFGIKENRDTVAWRHDVEEALEFVADKPVDIIDMFRLGRSNAEKTRPVLVKVRVATGQASTIKEMQQAKELWSARHIHCTR
jgi:hypothetical protein